MAVAAAVLLLTATFFVFQGSEEPRTVTAHFPRAVSVYEGTDVKVQGVKIGSVTAVVPEGNSVRVEMEYEAKYSLPAGAQAVIITPTLVADRFVQLTPAYVKGEKLDDGAEIALHDTGVPVELDRIYASLRDLSAALGPNGVNKDGTLNHLLTAAAKNLKGKGAQGNRMINDLSEAAETFGRGSGDLFQTVESLAEFTAVIARNDELVRAFLQDLAGVSADLAAERTELEQALAEVAGAVGAVEAFVKDNREMLVKDLRKLTRVTRTVASEKASLDRALRAAPVGIGNLNIAFDSASGSIGSRIGIAGNAADADGFLCSVVQQAQMPKATKALACQVFEMLLEPALARRTSGTAARPGAPEPVRQQPPAQQSPAEQAPARYRSEPTTSLGDLMGER